LVSKVLSETVRVPALKIAPPAPSEPPPLPKLLFDPPLPPRATLPVKVLSMTCRVPPL
jgi:hypothetical protein